MDTDWRRLVNRVLLWMVIKVDADLAARFDVKVAHPTSAVGQQDLNVVMARLQLDYANRRRSIALGLAIDVQGKAAGICSQLDLAVLHLVLLLGVSRRRSAG